MAAALAGAAAWGVAGGVGASAAPVQFRLSDHPAGACGAPSYGLRLDGLFDGALSQSGGATATSFSFDHPESDVVMEVMEHAGKLSLHISGLVYGGEVDGGGYGYGEGLYRMRFGYVLNVEEDGLGYTATSHPLNFGMLESVGNDDVGAGAVFHFYDDGSAPFRFAQDSHLLGGFPSMLGEGFWVGRGMARLGGGGRVMDGSRSWLFLGTAIPLPGAAALGAAGLLGAGAARRRRG